MRRSTVGLPWHNQTAPCNRMLSSSNKQWPEEEERSEGTARSRGRFLGHMMAISDARRESALLPAGDTPR